jgi:mannose-6-phosphate isomerase-like protein (cupin superfamily)
MKIVNKPWGHEKIWAHSEKYVGKVLVINPGHRLSRQYHEIKDESIYVMTGTLMLELGDESNLTRKVLRIGDHFRIKPGTIHRFANESGSIVALMEVSTPELDDVVRLSDDYSRN